MLTRTGFDGLDLDWDYPGAPDRGGQAQDTDNYVLLLKTLRRLLTRARAGLASPLRRHRLIGICAGSTFQIR